MRRLWTAFERGATIADRRGATVVMEWPKRCDYWKDKQVVRYLAEHGYSTASVHGCAVGLTSVCKATKGRLVKKEWQLATNKAEIARRLEKRCPGGHQCVPVLNQDTKASENYSVQFALHVREAIRAQTQETVVSVPVGGAVVTTGLKVPDHVLYARSGRGTTGGACR